MNAGQRVEAHFLYLRYRGGFSLHAFYGDNFHQGSPTYLTTCKLRTCLYSFGLVSTWTIVITQASWNRPWFFLDYQASREGNSGKGKGLLFWFLGHIAHYLSIVDYYQRNLASPRLIACILSSLKSLFEVEGIFRPYLLPSFAQKDGTYPRRPAQLPEVWLLILKSASWYSW